MFMVRSDSHVDCAWLRVDEPTYNRWMYSHRHGTVFKTREEAEQAMREAYRLHVESGESRSQNLSLTVVKADSLESMYGDFYTCVPESR